MNRHRALAVATALALPLVMPSSALADEGPAGGAPLDQVAIGGAAFALVTLVLLGIGLAHRGGRIVWLSRLADFSERVSGLPR